MTASSPLQAAVALISPKPSAPSSVTTRTSVNVEASCTTRWPRTFSPGFARALTVVVSTAAILGTGRSGTNVGHVLERGRGRRHTVFERLHAALGGGFVGPVGVAVQLLPAARLGDDNARRARSRWATR